MKTILLFFLVLGLTACNGQKDRAATPPSLKVVKSEDQWKQRLTSEEYHVLREKGTERPFTGEYDGHFEKGHYACRACGQKLFESGNKFASGCGWPSFDQAIRGSVNYSADLAFGMERTEVTCSSCGGHLGHVFDDGPKKTTGQRYCMNSVSLKFVPEK